jgi:hypothetical protein
LSGVAGKNVAWNNSQKVEEFTSITKYMERLRIEKKEKYLLFGPFSFLIVKIYSVKKYVLAGIPSVNLNIHLVFIILFSSFLINVESSYGQTEVTPSLPVANWLYLRGPFDPRPYDNTLFGSLIFKEDYFNLKNQLWVDHGISFGGYISANIQGGSVGGPTHQISETLLLMTWEIVRKKRSAGRIVVGFAHDYTFGRPTTREFANNQRLAETPNDLDTDPELTFTTLGLLHWTHEWRTGPNGGWGLRAGQLYAPSYFGAARYLDDDRRFFMARPLAAAAGAQWVGFNDIGLGINGIYWKTPIYVSLAVMDGKANRIYPDFNSLFDGQMLYLGEVGLEWNVDEDNEAAIRFTLSHLDVTDGENPSKGPGQSAMISGDIRFKGKWALAGRWSRSFNRFSADYQELGSLGILWLKPFRRSQDLAGLGFFAGRPSDPVHKLESGIEVYYKLQLTNAVSFVPDLQYWLRNDGDGEKTRTWVLGFRSEIEF